MTLPGRRRTLLPMRAALPILLLLTLTPACRPKRHPSAPTPQAAVAGLREAEAHPDRPAQAAPLLQALQADLALHRRLVLLVADEAALQGTARQAALEQGHRIHHERRTLVSHLDAALARLAALPAAQRDKVAHALMDWMEQDHDLLDLDRLAFGDPLRVLRRTLTHGKDPEAPALLSRLDGALRRIDQLQAEVEAEYRPLLDVPTGAPGRRPRWEAYIASLRQRLGAPAPVSVPAGTRRAQGPERELTGMECPDHTLVLTFDDGPHHVYTEALKELLAREQVPAVFFQVGRNLGHLDTSGSPQLGPLAAVTRDLVAAGFLVGNHSFTHAQLSHEQGASLDQEIRATDLLLQAIPGAHSQLFRFPYGARTALQLEALKPYHLRSVLWNIDSLDWADPVPASVEARVLGILAKEKRGILLFHDIHDRALRMLPDLIRRLRAEGYHFAGLDREGNLTSGQLQRP